MGHGSIASAGSATRQSCVFSMKFFWWEIGEC
jgi:hypothetical protein